MTYPEPTAPESSAAPWDAAAADQARAAVEAALTRALASPRRTDGQRRICEIYRTLAQRYHREQDPLLGDVPEAVRRLLGDWRG